MPLLEIIQYPDPMLKMKADEVKNIDAAVQSFVQDMADTLRASPGIGLAAPQLGRLLRIIALDLSRKEKNRSLEILLNPVIVLREGRKIVREGCLSLPAYTANVERAEKVAIRAMDADGNEIEREASGLESIVLQHEIDHLDGIFFMDRVRSLKTDVFRRKGHTP